METFGLIYSLQFCKVRISTFLIACVTPRLPTSIDSDTKEKKPHIRDLVAVYVNVYHVRSVTSTSSASTQASLDSNILSNMTPAIIGYEIKCMI